MTQNERQKGIKNQILSYTNKHQSKEREYWGLFTSGYRGRRDLYSKYLLTVIQHGISTCSANVANPEQGLIAQM